MAPAAADPARGAFVRTQVAALRRAAGADVELYEFRHATCAACVASTSSTRTSA
jgi:hypothetical protein